MTDNLHHKSPDQRRRFDFALVGWPQWVRVPWLRGVYFPFWTAVSAVRRAVIANRSGINLVTNEELWKLTEQLDEHPDDWHHACMCATCRSYADG